MKDHDESLCDGLHIKADFTIRAYGISKGAEDFEKWFNDVFKLQNPSAASDFNFSRTKDHEEEDCIEVMQHNPLLSIDALEVLFEAYRVDQEPVAKTKTKKKSVAFNKNLN